MGWYHGKWDGNYPIIIHSNVITATPFTSILFKMLCTFKHQKQSGNWEKWKCYVLFLKLILLTSTVISSSNEDSDFFQINKKLRKQKAYRRTKICFSYQESIRLSGASCYLCQYSLFSEPPAKKLLEKSEKFAKKMLFKKLTFSITQQLFAKLLTHSSNSLPPLKTHLEVFLN